MHSLLRVRQLPPLCLAPSRPRLRRLLPLFIRPLSVAAASTTMASAAPARQTVEYGKKQVQIFSSAEDLQQALGPYISSMSAINLTPPPPPYPCLFPPPLTPPPPLSPLSSANIAVKERGQFTVAFSGGSLPATVGASLTSPSESLSIASTLPLWRVFFADERLVPLSDSESNYAVTHKAVLSHFPTIPSQRVHTIDPSLLHSPTDAAAAYQQTIVTHVPDTTFDLILLGIGPDGHTCSLFPSHPLLHEQTLLIAPITDSPKPPPQRITMTLPLVNKARHAVFVVTGDKADALHGALEVPEKRLPSGMVEAENTAFFVDTKAAAKLSKAKL